MTGCNAAGSPGERRPEYRLGRIHLEPSGKTLEGKRDVQGTTVVAPLLMLHVMVVAELEVGNRDK